jgi:hypothetical protein
VGLELGAGGAGFELVEAAEDAFAGVLGHRGLGVVLVVEREVVEEVFALAVHAVESVGDDDVATS